MSNRKSLTMIVAGLSTALALTACSKTVDAATFPTASISNVAYSEQEAKQLPSDGTITEAGVYKVSGNVTTPITVNAPKDASVVLRLDGATINSTVSIKQAGDVVLYVAGDSSISSTDGHGVDSKSNLTIDGPGKLTELSGQYGSARSALRQTSRRLRRQHGLGLVDHLARRIGGTRAGSAGYVWYLTAAGQRLTDEGRKARRRFQEPSALFLAHTLAITQARVVIEQAIHAVGGHLARLRTEPACWRSWLRLGGALGWLKPDLEAITATDTGTEYHWLLEVDLDTEHPARLLAKCHDYQAHLASGTFQAQHGYYPQVVWLLTNQARAGRLAEQIAADQTLTPELFKITAAPEQLAALIQRGS